MQISKNEQKTQIVIVRKGKQVLERKKKTWKTILNLISKIIFSTEFKEGSYIIRQYIYFFIYVHLEHKKEHFQSKQISLAITGPVIYI